MTLREAVPIMAGAAGIIFSGAVAFTIVQIEAGNAGEAAKENSAAIDVMEDELDAVQLDVRERQQEIWLKVRDLENSIERNTDAIETGNEIGKEILGAVRGLKLQ